jgi:hypothetical protein
MPNGRALPYTNRHTPLGKAHGWETFWGRSQVQPHILGNAIYLPSTLKPLKAYQNGFARKCQL